MDEKPFCVCLQTDCKSVPLSLSAFGPLRDVPYSLASLQFGFVIEKRFAYDERKFVTHHGPAEPSAAKV